MVRVLHLFSRTPDFQAERGAAILAREGGSGFSIASRSIGRGGDYRSALFAFFALRGKVDSDFDVIHLWDMRAFAAMPALSGNIIFSPSECLNPRATESARQLMLRRNLHLVCASPVEEEHYLACGIPEQRCHLIPPGVDSTQVRPGRDPALRAALGFSEQDVVLLAPGESTRPAGHRDALWAVSILHVLHPKWKILLWGRGEQAGSCARFVAKVQQPNVLTIAERKLGRRVEFEELTPAADAVISAPSGPTPALPLAICMTAGLPIISTASPWTEELLKDGQNAALVDERSPRLLAQRAIEVMDNSQLRSAIAAAARREAVRQFPLNKFVARYRALYQKIGGDNRKAAEPTLTILRAVDSRVV
jgi:glycosyltransferase involved in cell wall biosynthesis